MSKRPHPGYSAAAGITLLALIAFGWNHILGQTRIGSQRIDLTANQVFSLSNGTKNILNSIDTPVTIRYFFTEDSRALPREIKLFALRVRDLLQQYEYHSNDNLTVEFIDVQPNTNEEDSARLDGIQGRPISPTETIYFGISITCLDQKVSIPFLDPNRESLLEYDVSRGISHVIQPQKPRLGLMSGLPLSGPPSDLPPQLQAQMGGGSEWIIYSQLQYEYDILNIPLNTQSIPDDIDALLVIHPIEITHDAEIAINNYLRNGGHAAIFLDAYQFFSDNNGNPMMQGIGELPSTLPNLLPAWGINFENTRVVADNKFRYPLPDGRRAIGFNLFNSDAFNEDDVVVNQIDNIFMLLPGGFHGTPVDNLNKDTLISSSGNTSLVDGFRASQLNPALANELTPAIQHFDMVIRLHGNFPNAFPDNNHEHEHEHNDNASQEQQIPHTPDAKGVAVLFADVDMLTDDGAFHRNPMMPQLVSPSNGNFSLVMNVLEQLTGDPNLVGARSRPASRRPFTVLEEMRSRAQANYADKFMELQTMQRELNEEINLLQTEALEQGTILISPDRDAEIKQKVAALTDVDRQLRDIQKQLRSDEEKLEATLTWANILITPLVVAIIGLIVAMARKFKTAAR